MTMTKKTGPTSGAARVAVLGFLAAWPATEAALAQDWEPQYVNGVLQPLPDGFPSGPITLVAAGDDSTPEGLIVQRLVEYSSVPAPVDIKFEWRADKGVAGTWDILRDVAGEEGGKDGYINLAFASPNRIIDLFTTTAGRDAGVGLDDLTEIITLERHLVAVVQCKDVAWEPSWESLLQYIKDNPGKVRYAGGKPGDLTDMTFAHYLDAAGGGSLTDKATIDYVETGDTAAQTAAVAACEADVTVSDMHQLVTAGMGKKVDVILVSGDKKLGKFKEAPSAADVGIAGDPMSEAMQIVVPAGVDPLHVKWLNALWHKVGRDSYYKAGRMLDQVVNQSYLVDAEETAAANDAIAARMDELTGALGIKAGE